MRVFAVTTPSLILCPHPLARPGKFAGSPKQNYGFLQTSLLCIVMELAGGGSVAVAVGVVDR